MGRIAAPFGVRGWVKVHPYTERSASLLEYPRWWLGHPDDSAAWRETAVEASEVHDTTLAVKFAGSADRDQAAALCGQEIAVERAALPAAAENEYYWADLIGLDVVNVQGVAFGRVAEVLRTGANDVLVVLAEAGGDGAAKERLIPFSADAIRKVNAVAGTITVDWGEDW
ncbi:MAG: ribosome maturation factor RimM [Burkholderiales bacterium]